jgi:methyl-accepting chemotaxis protein
MVRSFLNHAKIGAKISLVTLLPLLGFVAFAGLNLYDNYKKYDEIGRISELAELAPEIGGLVHEMQKERGMSAGYIGSKGQKFKDMLPTQRKATNERRKSLETALNQFNTSKFDQSLRSQIDKAVTAVKDLADSRTKVDSFDFTVPKMAAYYTGTIAELLRIIEQMAILSSNADVSRQITAYTSFLQSKERSGIERAVGAGGFAAQKFDTKTVKRFISLISAQNTFLTTFKNYSTPNQMTALDEIVKGPPVVKVEEMRDLAINSLVSNDLRADLAGTWFNAITDKINLLKKVEDIIQKDLVALAHKIKSTSLNSLTILMAVVLVLVLITVALSYVVIRDITTSLKSSTEQMSILAQGETNVDISGQDRKDEIGEIARALHIFRDNKIESDRIQAQQMEEQKAKAERAQLIENLASDFETNVKSALEDVSKASQSMNETGEEMKSTAEVTTQQTTSATSASTQASANVQTVASASEELAASISEINRQVNDTNQITQDAVYKANDANERVRGLADAADKITNVVSLIADIAEQTNMLALNATIEAARAGEAGKGFAVVASEVKNLAKQTATATEEITHQIQDIQSETSGTVEAIENITSTIAKVNEIATTVASAVEEQGAATSEIARNVEEAAKGTQEVSTIIGDVNSGALKTKDASTTALESAQFLSEQSTELRTLVETFLDRLKAA